MKESFILNEQEICEALHLYLSCKYPEKFVNPYSWEMDTVYKKVGAGYCLEIDMEVVKDGS